MHFGQMLRIIIKTHFSVRAQASAQRKVEDMQQAKSRK